MTPQSPEQEVGEKLNISDSLLTFGRCGKTVLAKSLNLCVSLTTQLRELQRELEEKEKERSWVRRKLGIDMNADITKVYGEQLEERDK